MDADDYIAQYGHTLTESEKRYIRAFGAPQFHGGSALNPATPNVHVADAPHADAFRSTLDDAAH